MIKKSILIIIIFFSIIYFNNNNNNNQEDLNTPIYIKNTIIKEKIKINKPIEYKEDNPNINKEKTINIINEYNEDNSKENLIELRNNKIKEIQKNKELKIVKIFSTASFPSIIFTKTYLNFELSEYFISEIQSYNDNFIPLDSLPETALFCFDQYLNDYYNDFKTTVFEDDYEHTYACKLLYTTDDGITSYYRWIEVFK
jgi:hypothetical protein